MQNKITVIIAGLLFAALCFSEIRPVYAETLVVGQVSLPDGTPVPGASVSASSCSGGGCFAVPPVMSDEAGNFTLSLSDGFEWDIMASPPDNEAYQKYTSSESVTVTIPLSTERLVLDKPLVLQGFIKHIIGTVTYQGAGVARIFVSVSGASSAFTDSNGKFTIDLTTCGKYTVSVSQSSEAEWTAPEGQQLQFADDMSEETKEVNIVLLPPDGYLKGRILDPSGNAFPLEGDCYSYVGVYNIGRMGWNRTASPDAEGNFSIPLVAGSYRIDISPGYRCSGFSAPSQAPVIMRKGMTKDLGNIYLLARNAVIKGTVTDSQGQAVADTNAGSCGISYSVVIWSSDLGEFLNSAVNETRYQIKLVSGKYVIEPGVAYWMTNPDCSLPDPDYVFTGSPYEVEVGENEETEISLKLENIVDRIIGTVTDPDGVKLTDIKAWAYARFEDSPRHISTGYVSNGEFRLGLPEGTFLIGLDPEADSGYSFVKEEYHPGTKRSAKKTNSYEQRLVVKKKSDVPRSEWNLTFILKRNDAIIRGKLKDASGQAVTGISGDVSALSLGGDNNRYKARINESDGSYEISLAQGRYSISYRLETEDYNPGPPICEEISVSAGETVSKDFTLTALITQVMGKVLSPDDEPVQGIRVWARSMDPETGNTLFETSVLTDENGAFSILVPQNTETWVGTALDEMELQTSGLRGESGSKKSKSSDSQKSDSSKRQMMILRLRSADTVLKGKVLMEDGQPVKGAFVYAYSADGQKAHTLTDTAGAYQLDIARVKSGETGSNSWTLKAVLKQTADRMCYRSEAVRMDISDAESSVPVPDLILKLASGLAEPEMSEFKTSQGWNHKLSDGTGIYVPENVTADSANLKAVIHPRTEGASDDSEYRCIGYAYFIAIYNSSTGKEIEGKFDKKILITLCYTDEQLAKWGLGEEDIRPAYFVENSGWQTADSFTIDKENNKIVFETDHLSVWSLVAEKFATEMGDISNDRQTGLEDALLALQVCSGYLLSQPISKEADVNGDGKIGLEEVIFLLQKLSGQP